MTVVGFCLLTSSAWGEDGAVLNGLAGIAAAGASVGAAAFAADADKVVAGTNARANVEMTRIQNDAVRDTNQTNGIIALAQTASAANIAAIQNAGATERQGMISTEGILASKDKYATEREKAWLDYEFNVAKMLTEDKARQQQLQFDKEGRDLIAMTKMLRPAGANGGLEVTRYNDSLQPGTASTADPMLTTNSTLTQATAATNETSAQNRLTRAVASTTPSMAQRLSQFKGGPGAPTLTKLIVASNNLARNTATVRGSSATRVLAFNDSPKTAALDGATFRAARRGFDGPAHASNIGRGNSNPTHGGGDSDGGSEAGHRPNH